MTNHMKSFGDFSIFFSTSFLLFWPYALVILGSAFALGLGLTWQGDFIENALALWQGRLNPVEDVSLVFLMPAIILFIIPLWLCWGGGAFIEDHQNLLTILYQTSSSPYGMAGLLLTASIFVGFVLWSLWCARKMIDISWQVASIYVVALGLGMSVMIYFLG